ncbi:segregation/condensation protein A [Patescibacteria group bacterium]|nr:segregation/condensation protein A [Patescibacteria group bacterium]
MSYQITLEKFQGPLHLLLQLIEQEELDITEVSLAQVTDQYMSYLSQVEELNPEEVADFLVIAAKLLFIKSRLLLPSLQLGDEQEAKELEAQLKLYREYLVASNYLAKRWQAGQISFGRPKPLFIKSVDKFIPPANLSAEKMSDVWQHLILSLEPLIKLPEVAFKRVISIQEKINNLRLLIKEKINVDWLSFVKGAQDKTEMIVSFLALLELVKQHQLVAEQSDLFSNIKISKI